MIAMKEASNLDMFALNIIFVLICLAQKDKGKNILFICI